MKDHKKTPATKGTKDEHLGATEDQVKSVKTPATSDPDKDQNKSVDIIDPQTELTPG